MKKTSTHLVLSLAFLLSSLALYSRVAPVFSPPEIQAVQTVEVARPVQPVVASSQLQIEGVWEQYSIEPDGKREFMARLEIRKDGEHYLANPVSVAEFVFPKHTYRSFDHKFSDGIWSFREDWDHGETGEFVLAQTTEGEFVGSARHLGCEAGFQTVFVRVGD